MFCIANIRWIFLIAKLFGKNLAHITAAFVDKPPPFTQKVADEIDCAKYPSPFIYPLESPVFIGIPHE